MKTDISDFNLHFLSQFGRVKFLVAGRCFDRDPQRWDLLACEWYARHGFSEIKDDMYIDGNMMHYKSVDALVAENPLTLSALGEHLFNSWQVRKKELEANRIDPPNPVPPPPKPVPVPEPEPEPEPEPKPKKKVPWKLMAAVLAAVAFGISFLPVVPAIVPTIMNYIVKILNSIPG